MPSEITVSGHSKRPLNFIGGKFYCSAVPFLHLTDLEQIDIEDRTDPINLFYPSQRIDSFFIYWNFAIEVDSIVVPESIHQEYSFGAIDFNCMAGPDSALVVLTKTHNSYEVSPDAFDEFVAYRESLKQIYKQFVKLFVK